MCLCVLYIYDVFCIYQNLQNVDETIDMAVALRWRWYLTLQGSSICYMINSSSSSAAYMRQ